MLKFQIIFCGIIFVVVAHQMHHETVAFYLESINQTLINTQTFTFPTSADMYEPRNPQAEPTLYGNYDFIVVGLGASGSVLVNRLSAVKEWSILGIEAGDFANEIIDVPAMLTEADLSEYNWAYTSVPQTTCCLAMINRTCQIPRGRGVGGSTLINVMMYSRGHKTDYDHWEELGNPGWSYEDVLPHFLNLEDFHHRDGDAPVDWNYHRQGGEVYVEYPIPSTYKSGLFLQANHELGYESVDYNANRLGVSQVQTHTKNGRRFSSARAFIDPILNIRSNLEILTRSYATRILIDENKNVIGVEFTRDGLVYHARASKEVILAAGTIMSAQLLMLSGIGPTSHLEQHGISVIQDLEVGTTYIDQATFLGMLLRIGNYTKPVIPIENEIADYLNGEGALTYGGNVLSLGFYPSKAYPTGSADIEIIFGEIAPNIDRVFFFTEEAKEDLRADADWRNTMVFEINALHPTSVGSIRLRSANPFDYPLIDLNLLSDEENRDIEIVYEGIQIALRLIETQAFQSIGTTYLSRPLRYCNAYEFQSREYWYCAIRHLTQHFYHPIASCRMGNDSNSGAVVDNLLRVYGIGGLRIGDASIIPSTIGGHSEITAIMIGERLSEFIKDTFLS